MQFSLHGTPGYDPLDFIAVCQPAARWIADARGALQIPAARAEKGADAAEAGVPIPEACDAIVWLALTGVVPLVPARRGGRAVVPTVAPDRLELAVDDAATGRTMVLFRPPDGEPVPVRTWMAPVFVGATASMGGAHAGQIRFLTPVGSAFLAHRDALTRLAGARHELAKRTNAPLLLQHAVDPPVGDLRVPPSAVFAPRHDVQRPNDEFLEILHARGAGTFVPFSNTAAGVDAVRLHGGLTYTTVAAELAAAGDALPRMTRADADGMARALTELFGEMLAGSKLARVTVRMPEPEVLAPRPRKRRQPAEPASDSDRED